jgi:HEAT repeat protein/energy-coupling factor transporter ATP-binding protein EcfA2
LLYFFWGGHGFIIEVPETRRRLFYSEYDEKNFYNLDFISLQEALKKSDSGSGFLKQIYFIDACANSSQPDVFYNNAYNERATRFSPIGSKYENNEQFVLFASLEYEIAENKAGTGIFSQAVMEELNKLPKDYLLPDMKHLTKQVEEKLLADGKPKPVFWWIRSWDGSREEERIGFRKIDWREVCREMLVERRKLTTNPLTSTEGIALQVEDVYVPLGLVERKKQSKRQDDEKQSEQQDSFDSKKGSELYKETEITQKFEHDEFLEEVLRQNNSLKGKSKRIAIIGEPGAGKTTLLQQIADWVSSEIEQSIVLWVSLAELGQLELKQYLYEKWLTAVAERKTKAQPSEQLKNNFIAQFNQGRVWLLLDGLDEMSVSAGNPLTEIARQIREGGAISQARIVLTCRVNLWDGSSNALDDFVTYRTLDFSYPAQVEEFIQKWFSKIPDAGSEQRQELCTALKVPGKERIQDLVKNPLRLTLLCINWQSTDGKLPDTQAGLYQRFVDDFYKWKKDQFVEKYNQRQELNEKLGQLALKAINKESTRFLLRGKFVGDFLGEADDKNSLLSLALALGWLNQIGIDENRNPVYAFFHASFQEYFAAQAIDDWHFFLKHNRKNPSKGTYHIFEPQWKQVILLWLGREDEQLRPQKEEFIKALVEFDDGCGKWWTLYICQRDFIYHGHFIYYEEFKKVDKGFYEYRAYFLAAAGIAEFSSYSRTDEIVQQIVKWGFGYFNTKQQTWVQFQNVIKQEARAALQETQPPIAIPALEKLLTSSDVHDDTRRQAAESLGRIDPGNEQAIAALEKLLTSSDVRDDTRRQAAESLEQIDPGNEQAIAALVKLLASPDVDDYTRRETEYSLGQIIGSGNEQTIAALVKVLASPDVDAYIRRQAASSLGRIDPGNQQAIAALEKLLASPDVDNKTRRQAAESLEQIDPGNQQAIAVLEKLLASPDVDDYTRRQAAESLGRIGSGNQQAIAALEELLASPDEEELLASPDDTYWLTAYSLEEIDPGNQQAIVALVKLLASPDVDDDTRGQATHSLGRICSGNQQAIAALVKLLASPDVHDYSRKRGAETLGEIGSGNQQAIAALVKLLASPDVHDYSRRLATHSLGRICSGNQQAIAALVKLLASPDMDDTTRWLAASSLGQIIGSGNQQAIAALEKLLVSPDVDDDTRRQAAETLGRIGSGNQQAIAALVKLLASPDVDDNICLQAASSLGQIDPGNQQVIAALVKLLASPDVDHYTRQEAAESLGRIGSGNQQAIAALVKLLASSDVDDNIRWLTGESLGQIIGSGNEQAIAALMKLLASPDVNNDTREQAAYSLGQIIGSGNEQAVAALVKLLASPDVDNNTRRLGAYSLGRIDPGNQQVIAALVKLLASPDVDDDICLQAAYSLERIGSGNQQAIAALVKLLASPDVHDYTRMQAAESLGQINPGNEQAIAALVKLLTSSDVYDYTRREAAKNLGEIGSGNEQAIAALVKGKLLASPDVDDDICLQAAKSLEQINPSNEQVIAALVKLLASADVDKYTRKQAAKNLGEIGSGNQQAIAALVKLLASADVDKYTRRQAAESLGEIGSGNEQAIAALVKLLASPDVDDYTRRQAAESLGEIGSGNEQAKVVTAVKAYLKFLGILIQSGAYETLWNCTQNMSYPEFYKAWHRDKFQNFANSVKMHLYILKQGIKLLKQATTED